MLNLENLTYDELESLAKFLTDLGKEKEADSVYDYLEQELIKGLSEIEREFELSCN